MKKDLKIMGRKFNLEKFAADLKEEKERSKNQPSEEIFYPRGPVYNSNSPRVRETIEKLNRIPRVKCRCGFLCRCKW